MKNGVLICVFVLITALAFNKGYAQAGPPAEKGDPPSEMAPPPPDGKHKGLQIDKILLLKNLTEGDSTLSFKQDKKKGNMPVFVAHGVNNSVVEITGTEYNVREVVYHLPVVPGNNISIKSDIDKIGHLIGAAVPRRELISWMMKHYRNMNLKPSVEIKESYSIVANLLTFIYDPNAKAITFTLATEY